MENRKLHVYIDGTEYNIVQGSANLNEAICDTQMTFGDLISNKFEVNLYNAVGDTVEQLFDLSGKNIKVTVETDDTTTDLFTGIVDSCTKDAYSYDVNIVAYDTIYYIRDNNIAIWWNNYWYIEDEPQTYTLGKFANALLKYVFGKNNYVLGDLINLDFNITSYNTFSDLKLGDVLKWIGELTCSFPNINREGKLEFVTLDEADSSNPLQADATNKVLTHDSFYILIGSVVGKGDIRLNDFDNPNSTFEDYTIDTITGVNVYNSSNELVYTGTSSVNNYSITGNLLLLSYTDYSDEGFTTAVANIEAELAKISYRPCSIAMITSSLDVALGQRITSYKEGKLVGNHYIMNQTFSGSLLIDQTINCVAYAQSIAEQPTNDSDSYIENYKYSNITKTASEIKSTVAEQGVKLRYLTTTDEEGNIVYAHYEEIKDEEGNITGYNIVENEDQDDESQRVLLSSNMAEYKTSIIQNARNIMLEAEARIKALSNIEVSADTNLKSRTVNLIVHAPTYDETTGQFTDSGYVQIAANATLDSEGNVVTDKSYTKIDEDSVSIVDKDGNTVASMSNNEFRTSNWVMEQYDYNNGSIFNIFRRGD